MRLFFTKNKNNQQKTTPQGEQATESSPSSTSAPHVQPVTAGGAAGLPNAHRLPPKLALPATLHPCPYHRISLHVTRDGLLLCPEPDEGKSSSLVCARIGWGLKGLAEQIPLTEALAGEIGGPHTAVNHWPIVLGVVGTLRLFQVAYLLVITSKTDVGNLYPGSHAVHCVKSLLAIPLVENRARVAINSLAARQVGTPKPGTKTAAATAANAVTTTTIDDPTDLDVPPEEDFLKEDDGASLRVRFTEEPTTIHAPSPSYATSSITIPAPSTGRSHGTSRDILSTSSSSNNTTPTHSRPSSPISDGLATRLSFWKPSKTGEISREPTDLVSSLHTSEVSSITSSSTTTTIWDETDVPDQLPVQKVDSILKQQKLADPAVEDKRNELEEKIVRETMREFTKGQMYFAYDFDITHSLQDKHQIISTQQKSDELLSALDPSSTPSRLSSHSGFPMAEPQAILPLWRRVERRFWWNEHLLDSFIDAGLHAYVLPIMQGYIQISTFNIPNNTGDRDAPPSRPNPKPVPPPSSDVTSVSYSVFSRRSRQRAGLRYQRRGIDDDANVANFVETESIMQLEREGVRNVFSHVQIRGSIPLFWSQPGSSLKPAPRLDRSIEDSADVVRRHFERSIKIYGPHTAVNLAELTGREAAVTLAYGKAMKNLSHPEAIYHDFDFHHECAGLQYENIGKLVSRLEKTFLSQGFFWASGSSVLSTQHGVFRINCIDCLDRTNVVMSAFARYILGKQLEAVALVAENKSAHTQMEHAFNDVWANNGDAISRAYAGTSALKGDFTRTGKRDFGGILNDGMNSVMRMYTSSFSDYFSQACIDFLLGHRTTTVFSEFLLKLSSTDPKEMFRLSRIRAVAIETSASRVLFDGESMVAGWTLISPLEIDVKVGNQFVEKVLLVSNRALYVVSYDYELEKVKLYTRILFEDVNRIQKGAYILSALDEHSRDTRENYGFQIFFKPRRKSTRMTSYAIENCPSVFEPTPPVAGEPLGIARPGQGPSNNGPQRSGSILSTASSLASMTSVKEELFVAFKALPPELAMDRQGRASDGIDDFVPNHHRTCQQAVDEMADTIQKACAAVRRYGHPNQFVTEGAIVSLAEAQRLASPYAKFEYALKRLLWLGSA